MSQKELNYLEDIYNHETLIINILNATMDRIEDEKYQGLIEEHIKKHSSLSKKITKLLEGMC